MILKVVKLLILLAVWPASARDQAPANVALFEPSFQDLKQGPWTQEIQSRIQSSVVRIRLNSEDTNHCTAVFVDNQGLALTALHCLKACLKQHQAWSSSSENSLPIGASPSIELSIVVSPILKPLVCSEISVAGHPEFGNPEVVQTGWGLVTYTDQFVEEFPRLLGDLKLKGWSAKNGDFALLRFKNQRTECLPLSAVGGSPMWMVGFPMIQGAAAPNLKISEGKRYSKAQESVYYKKNAGPAFTELYQQSGVLLGSMVNQFGFSGSPALDQAGQVVALNSSMLVSTLVRDLKEVEYRETLSIEIQYIHKSLQERGLSPLSCR